MSSNERMIRPATPKDAGKIVEFVSAILPTSILVTIKEEALAENLKSGRHVSYVYDEGGKILGHANLFSESNLGILGNFAVSPSLRGNGIAGRIVQYLQEHCEKLQLTHIAGYALLQHGYSQRLFDRQYIPVGVALSSENPLNSKDELFSENMLNAEIALCKPLGEKVTLNVPELSGFESDVIELYKNINVGVITKKGNPKIEKSLPNYLVVDIRDKRATSLITAAYEKNYVFLGLYPSSIDGLNMLGFASEDLVRKLSKHFKTNNLERENFVCKRLCY